ncbi:hypothetical protein BS50DRAFT_91062 [Corynespora cassiicola Philippines]|uniref:Uncharacterized protein n=1 Tax=Corynespora cassiicola Philippines TaxID=1448308 RepID=A0A2T2NEJ8_CORCC|nr:hypothetical protein BS50DRAFT_91062 [Corynespora cassiicola Philippines]
MDADHAVPTPIRRGPHQPHVNRGLERLRINGFDDDDYDYDSDSDDAAPPPIARQRSASLGSTVASSSPSRPAAPSVPQKSPLRDNTNTPNAPQHTLRRSRNFSHPFKERFQNITQEPRHEPAQPKAPVVHAQRPSISPLPYRGPPLSRNPIPQRTSSRPRPTSSRNYRRLPPNLRRWSSLETIESVATTQSALDDLGRVSIEPPVESPSEASAKSSFDIPAQGPVNNAQPETSASSFSTVEEESSSAQPSVLSEPSRSRSSAGSSVSSGLASGPMTPSKNSTASVLRKLKPKSPKLREPLLRPEHLEIEKRVSFDQRSYRTSSSNSIVTTSSSRPSELGCVPPEWDRQSQGTKDWKASDYDTTGLTEAELKKCKKKGINPALYAEMRAVRKSKWVSPIAGNTFL